MVVDKVSVGKTGLLFVFLVMLVLLSSVPLESLGSVVSVARVEYGVVMRDTVESSSGLSVMLTFLIYWLTSAFIIVGRSIVLVLGAWAFPVCFTVLIVYILSVPLLYLACLVLVLLDHRRGEA